VTGVQTCALPICRRGDRRLGTEHLLLGLLREQRSVPADVLAARGVTIDAVRAAIVELRGRAEPPEAPGPPGTPANTYEWPRIPFVPSRTVHVLYSGMRWPQAAVINHAGAVFSAYGFTLKDIIVRAWDGNRWHVDMTAGLGDDTRFDFLLVLPRPESAAACLGLVRYAIEQHFGVAVTIDKRMRDVYVLTAGNPRGQMLRRYPDPEPGTAFSSVTFSVFTGRSEDAPMFPLEAFAVHSMPFMFLVNWFEEILGGRVIDETDLRGVYGFELKQRVDTPDSFIALLRDEAGLTITRERREIPTLVVTAIL